MVSMELPLDPVAQHYTQANLGETIFSALAAAGKNPLQPQLADLAPVDEFHVRGRQATIELAEQLGLSASQKVIDIGSGPGGASRYLAATYGCQVTGLDLTEIYVRIAEMLAERTGLADRVHFKHGSALEIPFPDQSFDVAWTQHTAMNIADKNRLYHEIYRVIKPGCKFALNDILAGPERPVYYPAPWAQSEETSFLITPDELREHLQAAGFRLLSWRDTTEAGRIFFNNLLTNVARNGPPPIGLHLLMGSKFKEMAQNITRNLNEKRIVVIEAIAMKP